MFLITKIISLEALSRMRKCRQVNVECSHPSSSHPQARGHRPLFPFFDSLLRLSTSRLIQQSHPTFTLQLKQPREARVMRGGLITLSHYHFRGTGASAAEGTRGGLNVDPALLHHGRQRPEPLNCSRHTGEIPQSRPGPGGNLFRAPDRFGPAADFSKPRGFYTNWWGDIDRR
jgi:hypothetical protein